MSTLDDQYWSNRYIKQDTGWDTGAITSPLKEYVDQLTCKNISILIPGCGNSYEAAYLLQNDFSNITLIDISTTLCEKLEQDFGAYLSKGLKIVCADFFEHAGQYDLVVEQTFFCALEPSLRENYAKKMQQLLKPGGKLIGLLFSKQFESGPPFGGNENEYKELFQPYFDIAVMEPCCNSIAPRMGAELFVNMVNKDCC
ncbi:MAG: methyltransferase [Chitinophagaceae bacterium]|nr:methyltransferase [Chitinophagaceae bacterium]